MWQVRRSGNDPETAPQQKAVTAPTNAEAAPQPAVSGRIISLKVLIHKQLLEKINLSLLDKMPREQIAKDVADIVAELLETNGEALNRNERASLCNDVLDELLGLGPLEPLLKDETINDILVNGHETVFVERFGVLERVGTRFQDEKHLLRIIQKIVSAVGRRVDESSPFVDARLADGSRVNAIVSPLAIDGSLLSIRKFSKKPISMGRMIELGSVPPAMAMVLEGVVKGRRNVIISGGTGSGKTTMLNALSTYIDERERIVTIEDSAELQLQQEHVARLETRPPNIEGKGEVNQRDLVKNALRMRPDRIILGECRAGEAFDMLQAMNTGHEGSMTTLHANAPREAITRLESMVLMYSGGELPLASVRKQIAESVHVVVQQARLSDGSRKVTHVSEVVGLDDDGQVAVRDLFAFRYSPGTTPQKVRGAHRRSGWMPSFYGELLAQGLAVEVTS